MWAIWLKNNNSIKFSDFFKSCGRKCKFKKIIGKENRNVIKIVEDWWKTKINIPKISDNVVGYENRCKIDFALRYWIKLLSERL